MKPLIGILGCGGALGRVACEVLRPSCRIRGGQRSQPQNLGAADKEEVGEWVRVDLYNTTSLADFCQGCDVILNCAGPSYRIGDRVALAAAAAGAHYVDTFGADLVEKSLSEKSVGTSSIFVLSAGSFPGLSGILPRWLAGQGFDVLDSLHAFAGGREYCSPGAGADLLLSSVAGFGIPDAFWRKGAVVRNAGKYADKVELPGCKEEVYVQRFLNRETARLARQLPVQEAHWYNIVADKQAADTILTCCARLTVDSGDTVLTAAVSELAAAAAMALSGSPPWYTIMVEIQGQARGETVRKRAILRSASSYRLSGVVAAVTVEAILRQRTAAGVYWAFEFLNPAEVMEKLLATKAATSLVVVDIPPIYQPATFKEMEEGIL